MRSATRCMTCAHRLNIPNSLDPDNSYCMLALESLACHYKLRTGVVMKKGGAQEVYVFRDKNGKLQVYESWAVSCTHCDAEELEVALLYKEEPERYWPEIQRIKSGLWELRITGTKLAVEKLKNDWWKASITSTLIEEHDYCVLTCTRPSLFDVARGVVTLHRSLMNLNILPRLNGEDNTSE